MKKLFFLFAFLSCSGCLYKCSNQSEIAHKSISIPYVDGDSFGQLTQSLIYQISSSGLFEYKQKLSDYRLEVAIVSITNDKIGFKRDVKKDCADTEKKRKNLLPIESRENIAAQVSLRENLCGNIVWGPKTITADMDYDYSEQDSTKDLSYLGLDGQRESILTFSVGQMETVSTAQDSALRPLYEKLAKNIVQALNGELNIAKDH